MNGSILSALNFPSNQEILLKPITLFSPNLTLTRAPHFCDNKKIFLVFYVYQLTQSKCYKRPLMTFKRQHLKCALLDELIFASNEVLIFIAPIVYPNKLTSRKDTTMNRKGDVSVLEAYIDEFKYSSWVIYSGERRA